MEVFVNENLEINSDTQIAETSFISVPIEVEEQIKALSEEEPLEVEQISDLKPTSVEVSNVPSPQVKLGVISEASVNEVTKPAELEQLAESVASTSMSFPVIEETSVESKAVIEDSEMTQEEENHGSITESGSTFMATSVEKQENVSSEGESEVQSSNANQISDLEVTSVEI